MKPDERLSRWRALFQRLQNRFDFVGAYLDSGPHDRRSGKDFLILVADGIPSPGTHTPHVIMHIAREVLDDSNLDHDAKLERGIDLAREAIDSHRIKDPGFQGMIYLGNEVRFASRE